MARPEGGGREDRGPRIDFVGCADAKADAQKWALHLTYCGTCRNQAVADMRTMEKVREAGLNEEQIIALVKALDEEAKKTSPEQKASVASDPAKEPEKEEKKNQPKQAEAEKPKRGFWDTLGDVLEKPST